MLKVSMLATLSLSAALVGAEGRCAAATSKNPNGNCIEPAQLAEMKKYPVSNEVAKRIARHYNACIYNATTAMYWLGIAANKGDVEATRNIANMLENSHPSNGVDAKYLRARAEKLSKANRGR